MAALRSNGVVDAAQVAAVILEADGTIAVIREVSQGLTSSTLNHVQKL
jgi:uncharacterized membrane protein YcaP (DUF421 family)